MIAVLGVTALALVAGAPGVLPAAAGGTDVKPPHDVKVSITDDTFLLHWRSGEPDGSATFSAEYRTPEMNNWMALRGCQYISSTSCDFSSASIPVYEKLTLRIRAQEGNSTSPWHELASFVPFQEAQIGPPKVHLEAEDKAITVSLSPPGTKEDGMWFLDRSSFVYSIVYWEQASGAQTRTETDYRRTQIKGLSPETTYCFQVRARLRLQRRVGLDSPVSCVNTTAENADRLPPPEHVQVSARNQDYVLQWNYTSESVTFHAQWLYAFFKKSHGNYEGKWAWVPNCENVSATQCVFPKRGFQRGIYIFRVQASSGNSTSPWSEEEKFDTDSQAIIPPPVVTLKATNSSSLRVYISSQDKSVYQYYPLSYEIIFWENASSTEKTLVEKETDFALLDLKALTVYCIKARALLQDRKRDGSSQFSETVCKRTKPGGAPSTWLTAVICTVLAVPVTLGTLWALSKVVRYVFFPAREPPSAISKCVSEQSLKNMLLSAYEEQTERCSIIENGDAVAIVEEIHQTEEGHKTYNSQTSEDSGNYSIEDESTGGKTSGDPGQDSTWRNEL